MHVSGDNYAKDIIQYRLFESYKLLSVAIFSFVNCLCIFKRTYFAFQHCVNFDENNNDVSSFQRACNLQSLSTSLKQEKTKLEKELNELKSSIHSSDNNKDKQILKLNGELNVCKQEFNKERNHRL